MGGEGAAWLTPEGLAPDVEAWLRAGADGEAPCERVIETSISWIFLFAERAFKLKKPVDLGILDFTTPEKRRWATMRELAFNHPAAPDIYRAVRAITRAPDGALAFDGAGEAVEWALEMRRFDETAMLADRLPEVDGALAEGLGRMIARYHRIATPGAAGGGAAGLCPMPILGIAVDAGPEGGGAAAGSGTTFSLSLAASRTNLFTRKRL